VVYQDMSKGLLLFHQGYTDIINCLGLINYYADKYDELVVLIRSEMQEFVSYFSKTLKNVKIEINNDIIGERLTKETVLKHQGATYLFHGQWDQLRNDSYKMVFIKNYNDEGSEKNNFVNHFYRLYDIPTYVRFLSFTFMRDPILEDSFYTKHNPKNTPYILIHEDKERNILCKYKQTLPVIELNKISNLFFDAIKLLENANEIYCIDSVWSAFLYCVDMRYQYFCKRGIPIQIQCNRGYTFMYEPHLPNWTILSY
jgi:hypothetical protein